MKHHVSIKGAVLVLCILGMLVLPAAAAPSGQAATIKGNAIDQGLKDDLWANHQQYRLGAFDTHVTQAESVIAILNKYGIDTLSAETTLSSIQSERSALETALSAKDKEGLKTVNSELVTLWKQFRTDIREAVKAHYGNGISAKTAQSGTSLSGDLASV